MDPLLLQKQVRDNADDLRTFLDDLKSWEKDMKRKDQELLNDASDNAEIPPVRSQIKKLKYRDLDRLWEKTEETYAKRENKEKEVEEELDSEPEPTEQDLARSREQAVYEKELGNKHVKEQRWKEAIDCYTRAILHNQYDAIFYANRALCYLKTKKPKLAETDCTTAIQLDKSYVKAYQRRALARVEISLVDDARSDFLKVLELEPNNSAAKNELSKLEKLEKFVHKPKEDKIMKKVTEKSKKPSERIVKDEACSKASLSDKDVRQVLEMTSDLLGAGGDIGAQDVPQSFICEGDMEVVAVQKPPHMRSKRPLKAVPVQEVETFADLLHLSSKTDKIVGLIRKIEVIDEKEDVHKESYSKPIPEEMHSTRSQLDPETQTHLKGKTSEHQRSVKISEKDKEMAVRIIDLPPVPKTSMQFVVSWKRIKNNPDLRYQFLKQVSGNELPQIFQDSLESKEFSEIICSLETDFQTKNEIIYPYLLGLSEVRRFSALVMFLSKSEKNSIKKLLQYCAEKGECSKEDLTKLMKRYEIN